MKVLGFLFFLIFLMTYSFAIVTVVDFELTSLKIPIITYNAYFTSAERNNECRLVSYGGYPTIGVQLVRGAYNDTNASNIIAADMGDNRGFDKGYKFHWAFDKVSGQTYTFRFLANLISMSSGGLTFDCTGLTSPSKALSIECKSASGSWKGACGALGSRMVLTENCGSSTYCLNLGAV